MKQDSSIDLWKKVRKGWGNVRPSSQVFKDKTDYTRKTKHKKEENDLQAQWIEEAMIENDKKGLK